MSRRALVTGAAGFMGRALAERLLRDGWAVRGVDCFTVDGDVERKRRNAEELSQRAGFELLDADLRVRDPEPMVRDADVVFHLAGRPGIRLSFADAFSQFNEHNVLVTQRLLEATRASGDQVRRFVYASSSSVYGRAPTYPTAEDVPARPFSPAGVTKLAGEHLCHLYAANWGVPTASLRYFTVYGPGQRPDMAVHGMIDCAATGRRFRLYGSGDQRRDLTYIDDAVDATILAATADLEPGTTLNVAGGEPVRVRDLLEAVEVAVQQPVPLERFPAEAGEVEETHGDIAAAADRLGWRPTTTLADGLAAQAEWQIGDRRRRR